MPANNQIGGEVQRNGSVGGKDVVLKAATKQQARPRGKPSRCLRLCILTPLTRSPCFVQLGSSFDFNSLTTQAQMKTTASHLATGAVPLDTPNGPGFDVSTLSPMSEPPRILVSFQPYMTSNRTSPPGSTR